MSLIQQVTALVNERRRVQVDDIAPLFPGRTRGQVLQALQNARHQGHINLVARGTFGPLSARPATLLERIRARCVEEGDCLIWQGAKPETPQVSVGTGKEKRRVYVRRVVYEHKHGSIPDGHGVSTSCETRGCVKESHLVATTTSERAAKAGAEGKYSTLLRCAKIASAKRAKSELTIEQVHDIRYGPGTTEEAGARHGISKSAAAHIRRGARWKDYSNPFTGLLSANDSSRKVA